MGTITTVFMNRNIEPLRIELTPDDIIDSIHEFVLIQLKKNGLDSPSENIIISTIKGFILFNLHANREMLESKDKLIEYINNENISVDEQSYVANIMLYVDKPEFLTWFDVERIQVFQNRKLADDIIKEDSEDEKPDDILNESIEDCVLRT